MLYNTDWVQDLSFNSCSSFSSMDLSLFLFSSSYGAFEKAVCKIVSSSIHNTWAFQPSSPLEYSLVCWLALYCFAYCSYFCKVGKQKKEETEQNSWPFDSPPTSCINPATWNFSDGPWKVLEFSSTLKVVAWKVFFDAFWLSKTNVNHSSED